MKYWTLQPDIELKNAFDGTPEGVVSHARFIETVALSDDIWKSDRQHLEAAGRIATSLQDKVPGDVIGNETHDHEVMREVLDTHTSKFPYSSQGLRQLLPFIQTTSDAIDHLG